MILVLAPSAAHLLCAIPRGAGSHFEEGFCIATKPEGHAAAFETMMEFKMQRRSVECSARLTFHFSNRLRGPAVPMTVKHYPAQPPNKAR
jgi:hypothetical protein